MPIRRLVPILLLQVSLVFAQQPQQAQQQGELDVSPALFTVLAAVNVAGYDAELDAPSTPPIRKQIRDAIQAKKLPVVEELNRFYSAHHQTNPTEELSQYVSFALSVNGPPDFEYRFKPELLPPDVKDLEGFQALLVRFYRDAGVEELWKRAQPAFDHLLERYHEPVTRAIMEANAYLRNSTSSPSDRRFQIYLDLLRRAEPDSDAGLRRRLLYCDHAVHGPSGRRYSTCIPPISARPDGYAAWRAFGEEEGARRFCGAGAAAERALQTGLHSAGERVAGAGGGSEACAGFQAGRDGGRGASRRVYPDSLLRREAARVREAGTKHAALLLPACGRTRLETRGQAIGGRPVCHRTCSPQGEAGAEGSGATTERGREVAGRRGTSLHRPRSGAGKRELSPGDRANAGEAAPC